jgi:hypothetical protein
MNNQTWKHILKSRRKKGDMMPRVLSIEEKRDLTRMIMDELHGTFPTYEMRTNT